jgi:hypothetical protein
MQQVLKKLGIGCIPKPNRMFLIYEQGGPLVHNVLLDFLLKKYMCDMSCYIVDFFLPKPKLLILDA